MKFLYYFARTVQVAGLLLVLDVVIVSAMNNESMDFLLKFSFLGMTIFMIGWMLQKAS